MMMDQYTILLLGSTETKQALDNADSNNNSSWLWSFFFWFVWFSLLAFSAPRFVFFTHTHTTKLLFTQKARDLWEKRSQNQWLLMHFVATWIQPYPQFESCDIGDRLHRTPLKKKHVKKKHPHCSTMHSHETEFQQKMCGQCPSTYCTATVGSKPVLSKRRRGDKGTRTRVAFEQFLYRGAGRCLLSQTPCRLDPWCP